MWIDPAFAQSGGEANFDWAALLPLVTIGIILYFVIRAWRRRRGPRVTRGWK